MAITDDIILATPVVEPGLVDMSPDRLERLAAFFQSRYVEPGKLPCVQMLVARRGELVYRAELGRMNLEGPSPLRPDAIFRLASMSKPITSVGMMLLVEEGLVALDDRVDAILPEWAGQGVYEAGDLASGFRTHPPKRPMQIIDLLRHTSGLTYGFQQRNNVDAAYRLVNTDTIDRAGGVRALAGDLARIPLEFSPGEMWNYSISTDILGHLIERLADQPLDDFLEARVFRPLSMNDTGFRVPPAKAARLVSCYGLQPDGTMAPYEISGPDAFLRKREMLAGGGGMVSTGEDYLRFCQMLANGGVLQGVQVLSPVTVDLMRRNHLPGGTDIPSCMAGSYSEAATYEGMGFGLGFSVVMTAEKPLTLGSQGTYGWGGATSTFFWIDPSEQLIGIFLSQLVPSNAYPIHRQMRALVYSALTRSYRANADNRG
ncbi:MAG TPA: serine hydrolase domain-containing protein [Caulobacteraceae bacterium]|nr:serine hydrolase domain-containing protein [Caulobacteraceae bacterium]